MKPTMPDLRNYQVPETKGKTPTEEKPTALKDKKELQSSIRFLKEQNLTLTEVNHSLEAKLFKVLASLCEYMLCVLFEYIGYASHNNRVSLVKRHLAFFIQIPLIR